MQDYDYFLTLRCFSLSIEEMISTNSMTTGIVRMMTTSVPRVRPAMVVTAGAADLRLAKTANIKIGAAKNMNEANKTLLIRRRRRQRHPLRLLSARHGSCRWNSWRPMEHPPAILACFQRPQESRSPATIVGRHGRKLLFFRQSQSSWSFYDNSSILA
jgi:hypothetical protein